MRIAVWFSFILGSFGAIAQTTHLIRGVDFEYIPDTAYLTAGDSIHFDPTNGIHNMTQTNFADWSNNQGISNGGFDTAIGVDTTFVIDTAGTYYFVCVPHGFVGMKGVLLVDPLTVSISTTDQAEARIGPNPTHGPLHIALDHSLVEVFDLTGRSHGQFKGMDIDLAPLQDGAYILLIFTEEGAITRRINKVSQP